MNDQWISVKVKWIRSDGKKPGRPAFVNNGMTDLDIPFIVINKPEEAGYALLDIYPVDLERIQPYLFLN